jgi:hypothetical protein
MRPSASYTRADERAVLDLAGSLSEIAFHRPLSVDVGMRNRILSHRFRLTLVTVALIWAAPAGAQQLGHKLLGALGLLAGSQPDSGLYVVDQFLSYDANDLFDREGHRIPVALDLDALANFTGFQVTFRLRPSLYMNVAAAAPAAQVTVTLQTPEAEASVDTFGLGDVYVQPVRIGWKTTRMDVVSGYAFYAPTGLFVPRGSGGVGLGQWTHEFSLGGTGYFDRAKTWNLSALASYDLNQRKQGIDITRGDTLQIQGGVGKTLRKLVDVGLAGYGLWQVRDDRGADLPQALRGARELDLGLGPEVDITLARIRSRIAVRYCRDVAVKARPSGQILVIGLTILARR